jgi:hypothetical protein
VNAGSSTRSTCTAAARPNFPRQFAGLELISRGFAAFREYLGLYAESGEFTRLAAETRELLDRLR